EGYKADRPGMPDDLASQVPKIKEILSAISIPIIEEPGFEADDVIGTLAKKAEKLNMEVVIVTSDKDAFQLVSPNIKIKPYGFQRGQDENYTYGESEVKERFGVPPDKITDLLGLMGDQSDNIPGVPSIGPKTAEKLLGQFLNLEDLLDNVEKVENERIRNILKQFADQARLSKKLATLDQSVQIDLNIDNYKLDLTPRSLPAKCDEDKLLSIFQELEFRKFIKDIDLSPKQEKKIEKKYNIIFSESELKELIEKLKNAKEFALDTETNSLDPISADLVGISISLEPYSAYYIPISHNYLGVPAQLPLGLVIGELKPILEDTNIHKIGQNVKFDLQVLRKYGINLKGISFDTMIASYVINPLSKHDLDVMALELLNYKKIPIEDLIGKGKNQITLDQVEIEKVAEYSCEDADITLQLKNLMQDKLREYGLEAVFNEIELPLIPVLADMEITGIKIDTEWLKNLSDRIGKQLEILITKIYELAGEEFNINSPQQLGKILYDKLKLPTGKKTKTGGYSTNEAELIKLAQAGYELPSVMLEYRGLSKLKSTYVDALPLTINPKTGRIHTSFNQAVTETGRLSSSNPNLQNIPIRTDLGKEIRRAFIPEKERCLLLSADYSQIELRMLGHLYYAR
ncbi:MAG: DNA polymerase, partial [Candidatus Poribacteria bacterium]